MTTIRKFVYATLLAIISLGFASRLATAQEMAHGKFTLNHDVRWQSALVPAGEYRFSLDSNGATGMLTVNGTRTGFMFMIHDTESAKPSKFNRLVLEATTEGSYVSAMQLPEFGLILNFDAPESAQKVRAKTVATAATASAAR